MVLVNYRTNTSFFLFVKLWWQMDPVSANSRKLYKKGIWATVLINCIHIFIVTGSFLYWCVMRPARQRFFIHSSCYLRILFISYLATFLGTNNLSALMCHKAVNQSINQSMLIQCFQQWNDQDMVHFEVWKFVTVQKSETEPLKTSASDIQENSGTKQSSVHLLVGPT